MKRAWRVAACSIVACAIVACSILSFAGLAHASRPVLPPGCEDEVQALLAPHALGDEVVAGWVLASIAIEVSTIRVELAGPHAARARITLDHPDYAPRAAERRGSFAVLRVEQPPGSAGAVDAIVAAIARNDTGDFWERNQALAADEGEPVGRFRTSPGAWALDGLFLFALFTLVLGSLVASALRGSPPAGTKQPVSRRTLDLALGTIVVLGALLRLTLSREVALEAWPHTRFFAPARLVWEGPWLAMIADGPVWVTSAITTTVLVLACLAPLTIFVHARYLLADHRAALIAAGLIAILPMHLRFSHSDVAFIGSMTISSLAFGMIHAATRERRWSFAGTCLVLAALPIAMTYAVRPDNMVYFPLLLATAFVDEGVWVDKPAPSKVRIALMAGLVCTVTFGFGIPHLLASHAEQVQGGLSFETLTSALGVLFSISHNALLNPEFSPPGLTALAIFGGWDLIRRRRRRLAAFLIGWLMLFLVTHAYVVPQEPYMQARYHLHLIIPYVLLATCGVEGLIRRLEGHSRRRWILGGLGAYLLASPLIHLHFIRDVAFNDAREWLWVHEQRAAIPERCTIVEYTGRRAGSRFARVGAFTHDGRPRSRWTILEIPEPMPGEPELPEAVREALLDPPECLYWYEGLPCFGQPPEGLEGRPAPSCQAIPGYVELEETARLEFESRPYDHNLAAGIPDGQPVVLRLYRARRGAREPINAQSPRGR